MALLVGDNNGFIGSNFNANDPSTWFVDFGRPLSQSEINYYAPQMQARYEKELRRQQNVGRSNISATQQITSANGGANAYAGQPVGLKPGSTTTGIPGGGEQVGGSPVTGAQNASGMAGSGSMSITGQNPYLKQMGDVMVGQMTDNFNRSVVPAIGSAAMASGGYGGSRQGVMEANANNDLQRQIAGGLANLYGGGFNTALNYDLGLRGNDLGFAGLDAQINQNNFNNRLNGANFGLGLFNQGMANNQTGINAGTNIQNTPMNYWSQFANQYNGIGQGYGSTTGSTSQQGNPVLGALGGAQLGSQIGNWWSSQSGNNAQPYNPATAGAMATSLNANGYWSG